MERMTEKQIAQTYYLDDIIMHEVVLETYQALEKQITSRPVPWSKADLTYKLINMSMDHEMTKCFEIEHNKLMNVIQKEYINEIDELFLLCQA
jgi:hypothetical protein